MYIINTGNKGRGRDVSDISQFKAQKGFKGEQETLLKRGTKFKVAKVEKIKEKYKTTEFGKTVTRTRTTEYIHLNIL
jgi:hypothetical protein